MNKDNAPDHRNPCVFIIGSGRSGTTLLRLILDSHPDIAISDESQFLSTFLRYRNLNLNYQDVDVRRKLLHLIHYFVSALYKKDPNYFWIRFLEKKQDVIALNSHDFDSMIQEIYHQFHLETGKRIWGDNTPHYMGIADYLKSVFPQAKFIHLIRDGRDVHLSVKRVPWGPNHVYNSAVYWKKIIHKGRELKEKWPNDWFDLTYEELLKNPEVELRKICQFLGTEYHSDMVNFYQTAEQRLPSTRLKSDFNKTTSPIDPKNCEKWKKKLSKFENQIFEAIAGHELRACGFETVSTEHSVSMLSSLKYQTINFFQRLKNLILFPQGGRIVIFVKYLKFYQAKYRGI